MKMQITLFTLGAIATALSWTPAVDANAHGIAHHHKSRMVHEKRQSYSGKATFYNTETGNAGSCGGYLSNSGYTVALNAVQYHSGWCGKTITISANGKSHSATIQDECPGDGETCKYGALDMSPALFKYFADESVGVIDISWSVGGAIESVVSSITGSSNKSNNDDDDNDSSSDDDAQAKKQAAASKAAAQASRSSASAAAYASSTAAAASRSSASAAAYASSTSAAAVSASKASVAAVKSASRASVASASKASVASVHSSKASVSRVSASASRASVSSASRASVSSEKAAKSSSSAAAASASAEAARPKNLENFDAIFGGLQQLAMAAQS